MRRPLLFLLFAACSSAGRTAPPPKGAPSSEHPDPLRGLGGDYQCRITIDGRLSEFPCRLTQRMGTPVLEMAYGVAGRLHLNRAGFRLTGQVICSSDQVCKEDIDVQFFKQGESVLAATFSLADGRLVAIVLEDARQHP